MERTRCSLGYKRAAHCPVASLRNWTQHTGSVARVETEFLSKDDDLIAIANPPEDVTVPAIETLLVVLGTRISRQFCRVCTTTILLVVCCSAVPDCCLLSCKLELTLQCFSGSKYTCLLRSAANPDQSRTDCLLPVGIAFGASGCPP